ncbi:MAG TPA: hypothetical protein ENI86_07320 [Acidimicrobiales bacterium]|nr:hypothetical protein [Acidimicrobiales bacterium]
MSLAVLVLVLTALVVLALAGSLVGASVTSRVRRRGWTGEYRVRVGPAVDRGLTGTDVGGVYTDPEVARRAAEEALVGEPATSERRAGYVMALRSDGEWDVAEVVQIRDS